MEVGAAQVRVEEVAAAGAFPRVADRAAGVEPGRFGAGEQDVGEVGLGEVGAVQPAAGDVQPFEAGAARGRPGEVGEAHPRDPLLRLAQGDQRAVEVGPGQVAFVQLRAGGDRLAGAVAAADPVLLGAERLQLVDGHVGAFGAGAADRDRAVLAGGEDDAVAGADRVGVAAGDLEADLLARVGGDPRVGVGAEQLRVVAVLADREQAQVTFRHVVGGAARGALVPVDGAGDRGAAAVALQLGVDVDEGLRREGGRGEGQDGRRDGEQGKREGAPAGHGVGGGRRLAVI